MCFPRGVVAPGFFYVLSTIGVWLFLWIMDIGVSQTKAQTGKGTGGFAVGLGIKYQKELGFNDYAKQVLSVVRRLPQYRVV